MMKLSIPETKGILFETTLEPAISSPKMKKSYGEGEIKGFHGGTNKVSVGYPYFENIETKFQDEQKELPNQIKNMMNNSDIHFVSLYCSFLPDTRNKFSWARFGVDLFAEPKSTDILPNRAPIAYDMFPDQIIVERKCKRETSFSAELKLKLLDMVEPDTKYEIKNSSEYVVYEPQIIGYGIHRPSVAWDFRDTKEKGIWGNKELLLVVTAPKHSKLKGKFFIDAEIESDSTHFR